MTKIPFLLSLLPILLSAAVEPPRLEVAARGGAGTIVVRAGASACERFAAEELRAFARRLTGAELAVVDDEGELPARAVVLGATRHTRRALGGEVDTPGDEGFRLKTEGGRLYIAGGRGRGPLYGVYELLERFGGCAWYAPGFEVVPRREALSVPGDLDETQRPAFRLREINVNAREGGDVFAARNKLSRPTFGPELGGCDRRFDPVLGKCHTFERLLPSATWFKTHPEYFSEVDGVRRGVETQLCLTNPDVLRLCTEAVLARLAETYPQGVRRYGVSPNDWGNDCRCAACTAVNRRAKSRAGTLIAFVNAIAERVEKTYPDVLVQTLAYGYTRHPPEGIAPRKNVQVCVCTIECDFSRGIEGSRAIENRRMRQDFAGWAAAGCPLAVWTYATDFACYHHPWPSWGAQRADFAYFARLGVEELFALGNGGGEHDVWGNLRNWLMAKWMWNPACAEEPLLRRFFADHFGAAADDVRAAFEALRRSSRDTKRFPMGCFESIYSEGIDDAALARAAEHLARAAERAEGGRCAQNVLRARVPVDFARAVRGAGRPVLRRGGWTGDRRRWEEERDGARRLVGLMDRGEGLRFCDDAAGRVAYETRIRALAAREAPEGPARRLVLEESQLTGGYPTTTFRHVEDAAAADGKAVLLPGSREVCTAWLDLRALDLEGGRRYLPRVRVKTNARTGEGVPFRAGVYSRRWSESAGHLSPKGDLAPGTYQWYALPPVVPRRGDYLWIGLGEAEDAAGDAPDVWIDRVEFVRIPDPE